MAEIFEGDNSLWGEVDYVSPLVDGTAFWVTTPGHGGIVVDAKSDLALNMNDAAWNVGQAYRNWLCFEEDLDYVVAMSEIIRSGTVFHDEGYEKDPVGYIERLNDILMRWYPEYAAEIGLF